MIAVIHSGNGPLIVLLRNKIVLIGFMGAGKSTIGRLLANRLSYTLREVDAEILAQSNCSSAAEIIDTHGEPYFRALEEQAAAKMQNVQDVVISTGGGIISREVNMENLRAGPAFVVYISASFEELARRVGGDTARPLFRDLVKARKLFEKRDPIYTRYADFIVSADSLSPDKICEEIMGQLK